MQKILAHNSPLLSSTTLLFLFAPVSRLAATPRSNDLSPSVAAILALLIPVEIVLRSNSLTPAPAALAVLAGGPIDVLPVSPPTRRNRTVFISRRNAAILSDGTLTVGCPVFFVRAPYATLLIGASTGGSVRFRPARADARKFPLSPDSVEGACERNRGGGGGGGGGGGIMLLLFFNAS